MFASALRRSVHGASASFVDLFTRQAKPAVWNQTPAAPTSQIANFPVPSTT